MSGKWARACDAVSVAGLTVGLSGPERARYALWFIASALVEVERHGAIADDLALVTAGAHVRIWRKGLPATMGRAIVGGDSLSDACLLRGSAHSVLNALGATEDARDNAQLWLRDAEAGLREVWKRGQR